MADVVNNQRTYTEQYQKGGPNLSNQQGMGFFLIPDEK
jgi:hypothetical protein